MGRRNSIILGLAIALALAPTPALALTGPVLDDELAASPLSAQGAVARSHGAAPDLVPAVCLFDLVADARMKIGAEPGTEPDAEPDAETRFANAGKSARMALEEQRAEEAAKRAEEAAKRAEEAAKVDKVLAYDPDDISAIGTQQSTGHWICCPSISCAYADAVIDGTVRDHGYYTCSWCTWTDWGGGGSADRRVGSDEELLREAYGQISAGRPTVVHVRGSFGEHWIALIGYQGADDPDNLTLENFVALDPVDGAQITASERYVLYGDGCEHVSDR